MIDIGRDAFRDFDGFDSRARWEMARASCWNVLECNGGSARFSQLAARKGSGLAVGQPSLAAIPVIATESTSASLEKLGGANQIPIVLWPDSRALFAD